MNRSGQNGQYGPKKGDKNYFINIAPLPSSIRRLPQQLSHTHWTYACSSMQTLQHEFELLAQWGCFIAAGSVCGFRFRALSTVKFDSSRSFALKWLGIDHALHLCHIPVSMMLASLSRRPVARELACFELNSSRSANCNFKQPGFAFPITGKLILESRQPPVGGRERWLEIPNVWTFDNTTNALTVYHFRLRKKLPIRCQ